MGLRKATVAATTLATLLTAAYAADRTAIRQPPKQSTATTIQVYSRETFVDITVLDAAGHPVHNLKPSDFTIFEDGQQMKPRSFTEHRSDTQPTTTPAKLDLPPNTFTNISPAPPKAGPINILLLDTLNTPMQVQQIVVQRMLDYLKTMPTGTRMAVFRLTTHLSVLQGLTTDPELLKAAITDKRNTAQGSPVQDPSGGGVEEAADLMYSRAEYTLSAMRQIARYLSGMPGRKNLIWFGGSFPLAWPPDDPPDPVLGASLYNVHDETKAATDLMARAHIAIYPVDGRGIATMRGKVGEERYNMDLMAEQTGGKAFYNTNGLAEAVSDAIDTGSNFYTLTYVPTNMSLDTKFRTITVKVNQPGLHLTYRNGYYAVDPETDSRGKKIETVTPMQSAMMHGSLEPTQILFKVKAVQLPGTEAALPANNQPNPKQMKAPYRHYAISYSIDIANIAFTLSPDGAYHGAFEFGIRVYNADGDEIVNATSKEVHPVLTPAVYQSMLKTGASAHNEIAVPAKGNYYLRIAVHDLTSDRVGAVEIPTSSITPEAAPAIASGK